LSAPWSWGIMRFLLGGHTKDKIQTMISTDVMISAAHYPLPATCHMHTVTGVFKPRFNKIYLLLTNSRLTKLLFLSSSYPKTQPLVRSQERPLKTVPVFFLIVIVARIDKFLER
jgi:hypothetical protein